MEMPLHAAHETDSTASCSLTERLRRIVIRELGAGSHLRLEPDTPLFEAMLDSGSVLALVMQMEETFSLDIGDAEVVPANFSTLRKLEAFVERKLHPAASQMAGSA